MHFTVPFTLLLSLITRTAVAHEGPRWAPNKYGGGNHPPHYPTCLNDTGVNTLVDGYTYLLEHPGGADFNATAEAFLSNSSFVVESDSILTLSGRPVRIENHLFPPCCHKFKHLHMTLESSFLFFFFMTLTFILTITSSSANLPIHPKQYSSPHNSKRPHCPSCKPSTYSPRVTKSAGDGMQVVSAATNLRSRVLSSLMWM